MNRALLLFGLGAGGYLAYRALKPRYDFRDKHVVITGGSRGLGLVLARQFVRAASRVSICSRDSKELARATEKLRENGRDVTAVECDVTDQGRVREFLAVARATNGPVDVLVNNAGIIQVGPFATMREGDFEQSLRTHFWAALFAASEVIPEMKIRRQGRIINIASIGGKIALPHVLPYTVGKFGLVGLSNGLRVELARHDIVVTTICPGLMRTGSHLNAEFKGRHEDEYAWFTGVSAIPGFSMSAERAARKILAASARGDAEVVFSLPAQLTVASQTICPNLTADILSLVDRWVMPPRGGIGSAVMKGRDSRGKTSDVVTTLSDKAAIKNNELHPQEFPPPLPVGSRSG